MKIKSIFTKISDFFKDTINKINNNETKRMFFAISRIQLSDKNKVSLKDNKRIILRNVLFKLLLFIIAAGVVFGVMTLFNAFGIIYSGEVVEVMILVLTLIFLLTLLSATNSIAKSFYYSEDNKVLVTYPASSTTLFLSKLSVCLVNELKRSFELLVPITLGFIIFGVSAKIIPFASIFWFIFPLLGCVILITILAALLSIPYFYIMRLIKKYPLIGFILLVGIITVVIIFIIRITLLIPPDIDLIGQWVRIKREITVNVRKVVQYLLPIKAIVESMVGFLSNTSTIRILYGSCFGIFGILMAITAGVFIIDILVIKPFFFSMMTKNFEFEKKVLRHNLYNIKHGPRMTIIIKEMKTMLREFKVLAGLGAVYILTPLLLLLMDTLFAAINTRLTGNLITYGFNFLLILLPLLCSNSVIATYYSKEGRAAYFKKTKPISPLFALSTKFFANTILSLPSLICCGVIFGHFGNGKINTSSIIMIIFSIILVFNAHVLFSAKLDIINPLNESYATQEKSFNINEFKSFLVGFIFSVLYSFIAYFAINRSALLHAQSLYYGFVAILIFSILVFIGCLAIYIVQVKAYYYEK